MFKKYIDNHPDSKLSLIFSGYHDRQRMRDETRVKYKKRWTQLLGAGLMSVSAAGLSCLFKFPYSELTCFLFFMASYFFFLFSLAHTKSYATVEENNKYDVIISSINEKLNTKENILSLLKELEDIQADAQVKDLEALIYQLKAIYLTGKTMNMSSDLLNFMSRNYEQVVSPTMAYEERKDLGYINEMEIGMTNLQKIL